MSSKLLQIGTFIRLALKKYHYRGQGRGRERVRGYVALLEFVLGAVLVRGIYHHLACPAVGDTINR
jgi:hypothetical protein